MKVLVTGGAGYIGSHTVRHLIEKGHEVLVYDNLTTGHRQSVHSRAEFIQADVTDQDRLSTALKQKQIEAVLHFAGSTEVAESIKDPQKYFFNNTEGTLRVLRAMKEAEVKKIVFSSSAAVYGTPKEVPVSENSACLPINPYGQSKLNSEIKIQEFQQNQGISYVILRYFNVAGAWQDGSMGEDHQNESHLIPRILKQQESVQIYGDDYPTVDGTCIRDYVHVVDLASAHLLSLEKMTDKTAEILNVGSERGYSVKEVISACEEVMGKKLNVVISAKRPGDPAALIASSEKIKNVLGWKRKYPELINIVRHAWLWHSKNPGGYK